ncbi:MAG: isochorismatase family protein [Acidimicrobiales bacterium]
MAELNWIDDARQRYERQGIGGRLQTGRRPALLVVDLALGFTDEAWPTGCDLDSVVEGTRELLRLARLNGHPVIFTTIAFGADLTEGCVWLCKMPALRCMVEGSPAINIDPRLERLDSEPLVVKRAASAFSGTGLAATLAVLDVDTLTVVGATTSGCVRATVVDACSAGYATFVPASCVGDRHAGPHEANLFDMDAKYADVVDLDQAVSFFAESLVGGVRG